MQQQIEGRRFRLTITKPTIKPSLKVRGRPNWPLYLDLLPLLAVAVMLGWMAVHAGKAHAETPSDDVIATTQAVGGIYAPCLLALEERSPRFGAVSATNDVGPLDFHASELDGQPALWDELRELGVVSGPVTLAGVAEQVTGATWALMNGLASHWRPLPVGCG